MEHWADDLASEAQLVRRACRDAEAFALIYEHHYRIVLNYLYRRTLSVALAEELTSDTFFKALRALPKFRSDQPIRAWLYRIASNELRMHWRWRRRRRALSMDDSGAAANLASNRNDPEQLEQSQEQAGDFMRLHHALARLSHRDQTIISLRYFEQLKLEQIGHVIGKPIGSVKSRLHRALGRLKDAMEPTVTSGIEGARRST